MIDPVGIVPDGPLTVTVLVVNVDGSMASLKATESDDTGVLTSPCGDTEATVGGVVSGTSVKESDAGATSALPARSSTVGATLTL